jgi:predicted amidohydrolase
MDHLQSYRGAAVAWQWIRVVLIVNFLFAANATIGAFAGTNTVRVAACQLKARVIDFRLTTNPVLEQVNRNITDLEAVIRRAGEQRCDVLCLPEDTLGLLNWCGVHEAEEKNILPEAVGRMLDRLGQAAARHRMYLVVCSDHLEPDGGIYNTAFFLGRDGKEIGRYHKVCPAYHEQLRKRGSSFPVFPTPELGTVGMLICYDLVMPETARCLALQGTDIVFFPTMGGAAIGDDDLGLQALRVRAVENFIWLVVAERNNGAMIISPQGKIVARADGPDGFAMADIDPFGGREGGDALNWQHDMRARLFRERNPAAFGILTDSAPAVLNKVPIGLSSEEAYRIAGRVLTVGEEEFGKASALVRAGKVDEAIDAFVELSKRYPDSWIDREAKQRVLALRRQSPTDNAEPKADQNKSPPAAEGDAFTNNLVAQSTLPRGPGLAARFRADSGIASHPAVIFADDFEAGELGNRWDEQTSDKAKALSFASAGGEFCGRRCLKVEARLGDNQGGGLTKWFEPADPIFVRFYVRFDPNCDYVHHFVTLRANKGLRGGDKWSGFGGAGLRPAGDERFSTALEPWGNWGRWPAPGKWNFYSYWHEMRISPDGKYWGNSFLAEPQEAIPKDHWICAEFMLKQNTPGQPNGEQAFWIDGRLLGHWRGMNWRKTQSLNANALTLESYVTDRWTKNLTNIVFFDNLVIAREYIGPAGHG